MRKFVLCGVACLALGLSSAANAVEIPTPINSAILNAFGTSGPFGSVISGQASFSDVFQFTLDSAFNTDGQVGTIDLVNLDNINFTSIFIDNPDPLHTYTKTSTDPDPEQWKLSPVVLDPGLHYLYVNGDIPTQGNASYSATLNIGPPGAVPEPRTWALMLLGFAGVGLALRRRRQPVLAQIA